eukprot:819637-Rhodomonas_salina.1
MLRRTALHCPDLPAIADTHELQAAFQKVPPTTSSYLAQVPVGTTPRHCAGTCCVSCVCGGSASARYRVGTLQAAVRRGRGRGNERRGREVGWLVGDRGW